MGQVAMAALAASVAAGYFTIAAAVAPRIRMPSASDRVVLVVRMAAIAFFVGCGMTHVHIFVHTVGFGAPQPVEGHEVVFHAMQAVGAWLFILGAILRLELHVVPAETRAELQAAVAEQRRLTEHAEQLAHLDELTGLARRWRFDQELERQVAHAARYGHEAALVLVDVDGLKPINDTHGHQAGDRVLEHLGETMRSVLRVTDIAARIGGDEFAIILPEAGIEEAEQVARKLVALLGADPPTGVPAVSVSVGVAQVDADTTAADVMSKADTALYLAKRAGGDRHVLSYPAPAAPGVGGELSLAQQRRPES